MPIELTSALIEATTRMSSRDRKAVLAAAGTTEWERCADDVFYWIDPSKHIRTAAWPAGLPYVFTKDEHQLYVCRHCSDSASHPFNKLDAHLRIFHNTEEEAMSAIRGHFVTLPEIRPLPMMPYFPPIIEWWTREPHMCWEKSRDMMATWLAVTLYTWDTIFHRGRLNIFQSETAPKTCDLVERAHLIYNHQPRFLRSQHRAYFNTTTTRAGMLNIPSLDSRILGFPQGPDQIRQYHPSGVYVDEAAYQISAGDAFAAIKPAVQGGGRYTAVSSANPSFFMLLAKDLSDQQGV